MQNRWNDEQAATLEDVLDECVYGSRLLGADTALVLHGGGNTSVKVSEKDLYGDLVDVRADGILLISILPDSHRCGLIESADWSTWRRCRTPRCSTSYRDRC